MTPGFSADFICRNLTEWTPPVHQSATGQTADLLSVSDRHCCAAAKRKMMPNEENDA
jgi:hypothetical protein